MLAFPPDFLAKYFSEESPKKLQKLSIYTKFPHQEGNQMEKLVFYAVV